MHNIKSIVAGVIILLLLFTACSEDFLDLQPLDQEVTTNFYSSEEQAFQALVAVYDVLTYHSTSVSWAPIITVSDILSDDAFAGGSDANDGFDWDQLNNHNIPTTNPIIHSVWIKNYIGVYRANQFLEVIDGTEASQAFKDRSKAEARFMRAYFYFEQVRLFENIPLLTSTISGPSEYSQPQASPQDVYNQIALDLVEAIDNLPASLPETEAGRVTKWAAKALLARAFLFYNGVYGADMTAGQVTVNRTYVLQQLEDLIANSGHDLLEDYGNNFRLEGELGVESVFEITHGDSPPWWDWNYPQGGHGNLASQMQGPRVAGSKKWDRGWSFGTVNHKLAEDLKNDPRFEHTILTQQELDGILTKGYQHTGYFSRKYSSDAEHQGSGGQFELNRTTNHRVIRFSDVLLMAAELDSPNKQQYLDRVRERVGLLSVPATLENIFRERRLELSLEGIRYYDLIRSGMAVAQQELTHSGIRGPLYEGDQQIFDVTTFNPVTRGFMPIPQTERDLSAGSLVQNQGY
jgi:starch-binding outer membrane protein, SusD/RagB family